MLTPSQQLDFGQHTLESGDGKSLRRECDCGANASSAHARRQGSSISTSARSPSERILRHVAEASVAELTLLSCLGAHHRISNKHPEAGFEGRHCSLSIVRGDVVDSYSFSALKPEIYHLRHALECAILGPEVEIRSPVVGKVLAKGAARAGRLLGWIIQNRRHAGIERVSSNDLVVVRRTNHSGGDQRIQTLNDQTRALETQHCRRGATSRRRIGELCERRCSFRYKHSGNCKEVAPHICCSVMLTVRLKNIGNKLDRSKNADIVRIFFPSRSADRYPACQTGRGRADLSMPAREPPATTRPRNIIDKDSRRLQIPDRPIL